jgi:coenzyme Q-binding protein COQ10
MAAVERELVMNVGSDALFNVITDFPKYSEFVDEVVSVEILESTETRKKVKFELEVIKRFDYVLEFQITPKSEVSWKLVSSNFFKKNEGRWKLKPSGSDKTEVKYSLDVAVSFLVPGWVTKKLTETNLPKMFAGFEGRAKKMGQG